MKEMTCNQLGGACDKVFEAETFQEIAQQSQQHGMEMMKQNDTAHIEAMEKMKNMSQEDVNNWMKEKKDEFNNL